MAINFATFTYLIELLYTPSRDKTFKSKLKFNCFSKGRFLLLRQNIKNRGINNELQK